MSLSNSLSRTTVTRVLRKRLNPPDYKEKKETDLPAAFKKRHLKNNDELYPVEVIEEDLTRYKVHYLGYSSSYDEWKEKEAVVDIEDPNNEDPTSCDGGHLERFSLYHELATRIKTALNSSRKESPIVKIDLPFDKIEFDGGLRTYGVEKRYVHGIQRYTISKFQDLNPLLGVDWHYRGININGDYCYVILNTVEFYLYHRRALKEYVPSGGGVKEVNRRTGDMLVFCFVKGNGTPAQFGKDRNVFVN